MRCVGDPPLLADAQHSGLRIVRLDEEGPRRDQSEIGLVATEGDLYLCTTRILYRYKLKA